MAEAEKTTLKTRIGLVLIVLGFISPLFGLLVPLFNLSPTLTATIVTALVVGGPEIFLIAGAALAGKEGVVLVKNRIKRMLGLPEGRYPATKSQYNTGLVLILVWFILSIAVGYIPGFFNVPFIEDNLLWISLGFDILFIVAIFGFGGHQLITKLGKVFTWEPWELPPEKEKKK
ncbi:MAG: transporter suffix domain-containing protein [Schleiferiaceae bacterium]|nr:transporter suffix domain-containing protein [Schleiferiaceae bacterium]